MHDPDAGSAPLGSAGLDAGGTGGLDQGGSVASGGGGAPASGGKIGGGGAGAAAVAGSGGKAGAAGSGGMAGSGGAGGMAGAGGAGGSPSVGHRYARLVATSALALNSVWSSVAELQLLTTGLTPISRTNWKITTDSEETADETTPATQAIDGDPATFWHSAWVPGGVGDAVLPHQLTVDLGAAATIIGFSYLPRQTGPNGRIAGYEFYLSKDGLAWGTPVKTGTFVDGTALQQVTF